MIFLVGFPNHGTQAFWIDTGDGDGVMIGNEEDDVLERLMDTTLPETSCLPLKMDDWKIKCSILFS